MKKKNDIPVSDAEITEVQVTMDMDTAVVELGCTSIEDAAKNCGVDIPSVKAFALALEVPVTLLNKKAKTPIPGQIYDPEFINYDELLKYFKGKLKDENCAFNTMEELVEAAHQKDEYMKSAGTGRRGTGATGAHLIEVDGSMMPKRKTELFEMGSENESLLCFKKDAGVYKMVYQTAGYTAIRQVDVEGNFCAELVRVISNGTLNVKCVPPTELVNAINDRFSGEYQKRHLYDKDVVGMVHPEENNEEVAAAAEVEAQ